MRKCRYTDSDGNEISLCLANGVALSPHDFREAETIHGEYYTVQILECRNCGAISFGWTKVRDEDD